MINCLIVDDEPLARQVISLHLDRFPDWKVVKECMNATEAWQALHEYEVQVMFLDIRMQGINGVDFLRSLKHPPLVIFTTAFSDYAVDGFELMAIDYLLKPITFERFKQSIVKVHDKLSQPAISVKESPAVITPASLSSDHIFMKLDSKLVRISFEDLLYLEAQRDFTKIFLREKQLLVGFHLKMLEEMLPREKFFRVHRSYIINTLQITSIEGNRIFIQKAEIPIGSNYKEQFLKKIGVS